MILSIEALNAVSSRLLAFTSFFLHVFSSAVEGTIIFVHVDVPVSDGDVTGIEVTPTEVIQDKGSSEKGNSKVSTAGATKDDEEQRGTDWQWMKKFARQGMKRKGQKAMSEAKSSNRVYWNDPSDYEEGFDTQKEMKEVSKESGAKRKKSLPRKSTRGTVKRQKIEEDAEKEDLKGYLDIVPRDDAAEDVESLSTKYPIMDWKTCVLTESFHASLRKDSVSGQKDNDLMLWRFVILHILLMQNGIAIHMFTEKKCPLSQEMISRMLSKRLEVDHESTQAYELLKFIRSQVQK
ncbi:hypothetical protein Tco_0900802 [Tanacetum coccineum]